MDHTVASAAKVRPKVDDAISMADAMRHDFQQQITVPIPNQPDMNPTQSSLAKQNPTRSSRAPSM